MKGMPILHIPIEVKARELEGRALLAFEAASRGFSAVIGHRDQISEGLRKRLLPPGLYFHKDLCRYSKDRFDAAVESGCLIAGQDEESGLLDESYDTFIDFRSAPEVTRMAKGIFCWGDHDGDAWAKRYPDDKARIFVSGSPRVDLWRPDFAAFFESEVSRIRYRYGTYILISSNLPGAAELSHLSTDELLRLGMQFGPGKSAKDQEFLRQVFADQSRMLREYVQLIGHLSRQHANVQFVVRPHPTERVSGWSRLLPGMSNVHVVSEGGASAWLRAAAGVIHNGCTTGVEAYVSNVPAMAYSPFESYINRRIPNALSVRCTAKEEISEVVDEIVRGEFTGSHRTRESDAIVARRYANVSGETAAKRIVDAFETMDLPHGVPVGTECVTRGIIALKQFRRSVLASFRPETRTERKFPYLHLRELGAIQRRLSRLEGRFARCKVRHLFGSVYVVSGRHR